MTTSTADVIVGPVQETIETSNAQTYQNPVEAEPAQTQA